MGDYDQIHWDRLYASPDASQLPWILKDVPTETEYWLDCVASGASILDLGCGSGEFTVALARRGYEVTGVDGSAEAIRSAATLAPTTTARFIKADILTWQPDRVFSLVCLYSVLHHIPPERWRSVAETARRALTVGGLLGLSTYRRIEVDGSQPQARIGKFGNTMYECTIEELRLAFQDHFALSSFQQCQLGSRRNHAALSVMFTAINDGRSSPAYL